MDNRTIDVVSEEIEDIDLAVKLIWPNASGGKATHFYITKYIKKVKYYLNSNGETASHSSNLVEDEKGTPTLILYWSGSNPKTKELPFPLDMDGATKFIKEWLKGVDYGRQPDHDGSNDHGWRVFTEYWGHVAEFHYAILAVQPAWAMYGK